MPTRQSFDRKLFDLQQHILRMASLVENAIYNSVKSLTNRDVALANEVIKKDDAIDELLNDIEYTIIKIIATQQPIARDLRVAVSGLKIIISLERMGDHAVDIARIALKLADERSIKPLVKINEISGLTREMVKLGLDAYVNGDVAKARRMCEADDEVDSLYRQVYDELVRYMKEDTSTIDQATHLLFVCRYLERIADHATNIGEEVVYLVTGEWFELN